MPRFRQYRLMLVAVAVVVVLLGVNYQALAAVDEDGGGPITRTILLGTSGRYAKNVDYFEFEVPRGAIGVNFNGDVRLYDYATGTYPNRVHYLDFYAEVGLVYERFSFGWVYSGVADYYFTSS